MAFFKSFNTLNLFYHKNGILVDNPASINFGEMSYADFIVVETSYGRGNQNCGENRDRNYPEKVEVYGAQTLPEQDSDGGWILLTSESECRTSFIDVAEATTNGLDFIEYVKFVDVTDPAHFNSSADGFDVDGVIICPEEVATAITGEGRATGGSLVNAREAPANDQYSQQFFNRAPNEVIPPVLQKSVSIYPNPVTDGKVAFDIRESWENAEVVVYSLSGQLIAQDLINFQQPILNVEYLKEGIYFVKVSVNGNQHTLKLDLK